MFWFNYQARRWQNFKPSKEYLSVVNGLTTIEKLHNYIKSFIMSGIRLKYCGGKSCGTTGKLLNRP